MVKNGMEDLPHNLLFVLYVLGEHQYHKNWHHEGVQWCRFNTEDLDYDHDLAAFILCFCVSTAYMVSPAALKK